MLITRVISSTAILIFAAVTYVTAVPIQIQEETLHPNDGVYAQPALAEALARSYAALVWNQKNQPMGLVNNVHRNLDHIGGGYLSRSVDTSDYPGQYVADFLRSGNSVPGTGDNVHISHFPRQSRHGLDSLSGGTFGESKRYTPPRKSEWSNNINGLGIYEGSAKRNIDEIDRTGFDNFFKRNFDEIDRSGWDSFVKRRKIDSYLNNKQN